jgi:hypothetical protein
MKIHALWLSVAATFSLGAPGLTQADEMIEVVVGEAGFFVRADPATTSAEGAVPRRWDQSVSDGWVLVNGEAVWALDNGEMILRGGQLVHAPGCRFAESASQKATRAVLTEPGPLHSGA